MPDSSVATARFAARLSRLMRRYPLFVYFSLAYHFGWIAFLPMVLTNTGAGINRADVPIEPSSLSNRTDPITGT